VHRNSIYANTGLGIALLNGGNHEQGAPTISSVTTNGLNTTVQGSLAVVSPFQQYAIQLFASPSCDPSGAGEGQQFVKVRSFTTDASGTLQFTMRVDVIPSGQAVTATATNALTGDTSEFSTCVSSP
jgi:hypothetical protein